MPKAASAQIDVSSTELEHITMKSALKPIFSLTLCQSKEKNHQIEIEREKERENINKEEGIHLIFLSFQIQYRIITKTVSLLSLILITT